MNSPTWSTLPPLSLYIHIPWCVRKCPYCDFNSHQADQTLAEKEPLYIDALLRDLDNDLPLAQGRSISSIFIGGGTPSLFSAASIATLLAGIHARIPITQHAEITLEANPGTFEQEKFSGFFDAGINRLSIGIQSFQQEKLAALGRIHNSDEAKCAISIAKQAGFTNFNLDLMHGLPNQTLADALSDLQTAIDVEPTHLSWYQLTIEPNTFFYSHPPTLPDDDALWDIQEAGQSLLAKNGYVQYEISAYSKRNKPSVHNVNYWEFGDYLGIGAGAHGKITDLKKQAVMRLWKTRLPKDYLNASASFMAGSNTLSADDLLLEGLMNVLRLNEGIDLDLFCARTGLDKIDVNNALIVASDFLTNDHKVQCNELGHRYLNNVLALFSP
jgi:oxygen-independent coproporphyrinogen-3 oxidase